MRSPWSKPGCCQHLIGKCRSFAWRGKNLQRFCNPRTADWLSPYHDSQFLAFSTEVLIRSRPGHNRSSSPFTTLADRAERRVASTGAGQPNYSPKTWFGANAYNAKFGVPNYTYKKCSDFCCCSVGCYETPSKLKRTRVCRCYLIELPERKRQK